MDYKTSSRVICEGGLDTSNNHINLSANKPGAGVLLTNYEVGLDGGYKRIEGFQPYDSNYAEVGVGVAEGKILGIILFENSVSGATDIIAARKDLGVDEYTLYKYEFATGWVAISTGLTHYFVTGGSTVDKLRYDVGNNGVANVLCIVDGVNNAVLYDGTDWGFIDSGSTGADMDHAGGAMALDAPTYVSFFQKHLFLASDTKNSYKGVVAHSAPNVFYDFISANGSGQIIPGLEVTQIKPFRDNLFIFGINIIKKIVISDTTFLVEDVTKDIGLISSDAVVELGGQLIFLAPDGFRPIAGTDRINDIQIEALSKAIQSLVKNRVEGNSGANMNIVAIRGKSQFRVFFSSSSINVADSKGIIGSLRTSDQQKGWEFGELLGIRASCCASKYVNGTEIVLHGDYDGVVYRQESGNDFNGSNVVSIYMTPYLDLGDTETRKVIEKVTTFMNGEETVDLILGVRYDWGSIDVAIPTPYSLVLQFVTTLYDDPTSLYNDLSTLYGGAVTPIAIKALEGSFFSIQLSYTTNGTEAPHTVHGIVLEYSVKGRR